MHALFGSYGVQLEFQSELSVGPTAPEISNSFPGHEMQNRAILK